MPNANSFPDGYRGHVRRGDTSRVAEYAASTLPVGGPGMLRRRFPQGSTCFPLPARATGVGGSTPNPFDCSVDANGNATFVPGAGQNLVPGNMATPLAVPAGATSYVFLRLTTDGKSVQNCTLMIGSTAPVPPAPTKSALPQQVDVLLHLIGYTPPSGTATAGTYTPVRYFYPATNVCLTPIEVFETSVDNPQPGGPAYDKWYTWQIGGT